jgi:hypothetical protein
MANKFLDDGHSDNLESKASWHEPYDGIPAFEGIPDGLLN